MRAHRLCGPVALVAATTLGAALATRGNSTSADGPSGSLPPLDQLGNTYTTTR